MDNTVQEEIHMTKNSSPMFCNTLKNQGKSAEYKVRIQFL